VAFVAHFVNPLDPKRNRELMDDAELIMRVAAGDDGALRELFARHAPWLATRLRAVLAANDVEDVLQETFLATWAGAGGYRPRGAVGAWLWGIARRQAALHLRRRGPVELYLVTPDGGDAVSDPAEAALIRLDIARAVEGLGPDGSADRDVWQLMYVEDRPVHEVASLMGVPVGTVKSRAHRVRRILRAALGDSMSQGGGG
jgi:RNA polymerase sigma-70 factor, ECF subfamily